MVIHTPILIIAVLTLLQEHILPQLLHVLILIVQCDFELHVQAVQQLAVPFYNTELLALCGGCIVNILKAVAFGIMAFPHFKNAILRHLQNLNGLLYGLGRPIQGHTGFLQLLKTICK